MARIVFEIGIDAPVDNLISALNTHEGLASWWTDDLDFAGGEGAEMTLRFPIAPKPFVLQVERVGSEKVVWKSVGDFPPHWIDTSITWSFKTDPGGAGITLLFAHEGWASDEGPFPSSAYTWAQLLGLLKSYVEDGAAAPLFTRK